MSSPTNEEKQSLFYSMVKSLELQQVDHDDYPHAIVCMVTMRRDGTVQSAQRPRQYRAFQALRRMFR